MSASSDKNIFRGHLLGRLFGLTKPYLGAFILSVILTLIMAILGTSRPYLIQKAIDDYIAPHQLDGFIGFMCFIFILLILQTIIQFVQTYLTARIGQDIVRDLRLQVFNHILKNKLARLDQLPVGTLVTRAISDLETLADVFAEGMVSILGDLLQIIFIVGFMFYVNPKLTLVSLSILPVLLYAGYVFKNAVRNSFLDVRKQITRLNTFIQEHLQGMTLVQVMNHEAKTYKKFEEINTEHRDANNRGILAYALFFPVVEIVTALSIAILVWYGAGQLIGKNSGITFGILTAFIMYVNLFFRPIRQLADRFNTLQMGMVAAGRIFQLLDETDAIEPEGTLKVSELKGAIQFNDVSFYYQEDKPVLNNINFEITPGMKLALVGPTGAGKSSVIGLLNRSYPAVSGEILIDGISVNNYHLSSLRGRMAVVLQDVFLFSGSILDNLRLFDKNIPEWKVIEAAEKVGIHPFILALPNGYHQEVYERGLTLSAGQRQLIAFVRALLANPDILILDEATASIDTITEELIQKAIDVLMEERTCVVVAHRLSTIKKADQILVLENGSIVERGNHDELMTRKGLYFRMYVQQSESFNQNN